MDFATILIYKKKPKLFLLLLFAVCSFTPNEVEAACDCTGPVGSDGCCPIDYNGRCCEYRRRTGGAGRGNNPTNKVAARSCDCTGPVGGNGCCPTDFGGTCCETPARNNLRNNGPTRRPGLAPAPNVARKYRVNDGSADAVAPVAEAEESYTERCPGCTGMYAGNVAKEANAPRKITPPTIPVVGQNKPCGTLVGHCAPGLTCLKPKSHNAEIALCDKP